MADETILSVDLSSGAIVTDKAIYAPERGRLLFLPDNASEAQVKAYEAYKLRSEAENVMLLAAENFLKAHGYTVTFDHNK